MTNHSKPGRLAGMPKAAIRALKADARELTKDTDLNHSRSARYAERIDKQVKRCKSPKVLKRLVKLQKFLYSDMYQKLNKLRKVRKLTEEFKCNLKSLQGHLKIALKGGFVTQVVRFCEDVGSTGAVGSWKPGVKAAFYDYIEYPLASAIWHKNAIADLSRLVFPNSNKVAPHAGFVTWDGERYKRGNTKNPMQPYTKWVCLALKDPKFFKVAKKKAFKDQFGQEVYGSKNDPQMVCYYRHYKFTPQTSWLNQKYQGGDGSLIKGKSYV